jgi:hypothetical protein
MRRSAAFGRRASLVSVVCWALPGAAFSALAFSDGFVPSQPFAPQPAWLNGPLEAVLAGLAVACAFFWLASPVALLVVGIGQLHATATAGWRLPIVWTGIVIAGTALDPLNLWALNTTDSGGGFEPAWLVSAVAYLALGAALATILISAPDVRADQSPQVAG